MTTTCVFDESNVEDLKWTFHDLWVDLSCLAADTVGDLTLPLHHADGHETVVATLKIYDVIKLIVNDKEGIGFYDVNHVTFDSRDKNLKFDFNIPAVLEVFVRTVKIEFTDLRIE